MSWDLYSSSGNTSVFWERQAVRLVTSWKSFCLTYIFSPWVSTLLNLTEQISARRVSGLNVYTSRPSYTHLYCELLSNDRVGWEFCDIYKCILIQWFKNTCTKSLGLFTGHLGVRCHWDVGDWNVCFPHHVWNAKKIRCVQLLPFPRIRLYTSECAKDTNGWPTVSYTLCNLKPRTLYQA